MQPLLAVVEHAVHLLRCDARVLQGIGGVLVAELALDGGDVAGLLDDVPAHGMPGAVRGFALDAGDGADLVPDGVKTPSVGSDPAHARSSPFGPGPAATARATRLGVGDGLP